MRLHSIVLTAILVVPALVAAQDNLGTHEDRIAVEDVMARYVWAVDSFDADGYVAVFTDDAVIDSNGSISKGHAEIRKIVTGLIQRRDDNKAKGLPTSNLYHMTSNVRITFPKPGEALHQSYWQTVRRGKDGTMIVAAMGRSEDRLVKRNGKWLIQSRKLTVFTDEPGAVAPDDAAAIQTLVSSYARALGSCRADEFADLFAPGTGYFASGIRGQIVGRERLIALVQSERHCTQPAPAGSSPAPRPGGGNGPTVALEVTQDGVRGVADLGGAGQYQDEYVKTANGWRFKSRTVIIPAEKAAGLDAAEMLAIRRVAGAEAVDYYVPDQNGVKRLRTSGVEIRVVNGTVGGRAYLKDGGYYEDVYEKVGAGQWRMKSRVKIAP
jgi:3-phenylpropionate/cinnamic acid dioxygenase small subunit